MEVWGTAGRRRGRQLLMVAAISWTPAIAMASPPKAVNDARTMPPNSTININVLDNDVSTDGQALSVTAVGSATNGVDAVTGDGSVRYTPSPNYYGPDSFTYTVSNPNGESATATVTVNVVKVSLKALGSGANDRDIGSAIDNICSTLLPQSDSQLPPGQQILKRRCEGLLNLGAANPGGTDQALRAIAPEEVLSETQQAATGARSIIQAVQQRQRVLNAGISAFSFNGYALTTKPQRGGSAGSDNGPFSSVGLFASLSSDHSRRDQTLLESGYDASTALATIGGDYRFNASLVAGLAGGYIHDTMDFSNSGGNVVSKIYSAITYLSWSRKALSVDLQLGVGNASYDTQRHIQYGTGSNAVDTTAIGTTKGNQWSASGQIQWDMNFGPYRLSPFVRADYLSVSIDGYGENHADGWELQIGKQKFDLLNASFGADFSYAWNRSWGVILPQLGLTAISEVKSNHDPVIARFAFDPNPNNGFSLAADGKESLYYQIRAGAVVLLPKGLSAYVQFQELLGYQYLQSRRYDIGVRYEL